MRAYVQALRIELQEQAPLISVTLVKPSGIDTPAICVKCAAPLGVSDQRCPFCGASQPVSALFHDEPTIEAMNEMGLAISAVGNHEFDEGPEELVRMQKGGCHPVDGCQDGTPFAGGSFTYLAANVQTRGSDTLFPRYTVRELNGVRIAFIGLTLEGTAKTIPDFSGRWAALVR